MLKGELITTIVESDALRGNPLGDPCSREVPVYLPPGRREGLPLVAVLAGFTGVGAGALRGTPWELSFPQRYERLLERGDASPCAFVFPDAFTRFGGSQYMNSAATGRYEDYLVDEVMAFVEREYRVGGCPERRGLMGKSSGGFGALHVAMRRPDHFRAIASHSGDAYFEMAYKPDFPRLLAMLDKYGSVMDFLDAFEKAPKKTTPLVLAMNVLAMAAVYSPDPDEPLGLALPFEQRSGRLRENVWERWLEHDPVELASTHGGDLADYLLVFVDAGLRDEYHLQYGARQLVDVLRDKGVDVHHEEFDDGHMGVSYRYERSIPLMTQALSLPLIEPAPGDVERSL
ncbi:MAG: esterase [Planctomycetota bacterium]|nr:MAG: esterase [Planctomycetota bacterium]